MPSHTRATSRIGALQRRRRQPRERRQLLESQSHQCTRLLCLRIRVMRQCSPPHLTQQQLPQSVGRIAAATAPAAATRDGFRAPEAARRALPQLPGADVRAGEGARDGMVKVVHMSGCATDPFHPVADAVTDACRCARAGGAAIPAMTHRSTREDETRHHRAPPPSSTNAAASNAGSAAATVGS